MHIEYLTVVRSLFHKYSIEILCIFIQIDKITTIALLNFKIIFHIIIHVKLHNIIKKKKKCQ